MVINSYSAPLTIPIDLAPQATKTIITTIVSTIAIVFFICPPQIPNKYLVRSLCCLTIPSSIPYYHYTLRAPCLSSPISSFPRAARALPASAAIPSPPVVSGPGGFFSLSSSKEYCAPCGYSGPSVRGGRLSLWWNSRARRGNTGSPCGPRTTPARPAKDTLPAQARGCRRGSCIWYRGTPPSASAVRRRCYDMRESTARRRGR